MISQAPSIFLFDVDGTLIHAFGSGKRALSRAFDAELGCPEACESLDFRGATDQGIFRVALASVGHAPESELLRRIQVSYLQYLKEEIAAALEFAVLPGVERVLAWLREAKHPAVGLGTGNFEAGARVKLGRAGLNEHFEFGGFGEDGEERSELLRAGAERGAARWGAALSSCRVVVIGDTPRDIQAAHALRPWCEEAKCLAVATGGHSEAELAAAGADWVVSGLGDPRVFSLLGEFVSSPAG